MAVFKCKMCGGSLEISADHSIATCEYCGSVQTLPRLDDDKVERLYDRANHFRRNDDFDKAMEVYEMILNETPEDAEVYWSLVLCRYGIEYVEDPQTKKRIPTVNRVQYTSIFDDDNYRLALKYADHDQRGLYEAEANTINNIQKGILAISQKEEPFDVFICYKESDERGQRTRDSVYANDLYHELTKEGFKVFYARITLESKLGEAYEPYIFAALNTAKVMVVIGTKAEYFNAPWVKNEWSRYLAMIKSGEKKMLIPAYSGMDPYDMPAEFAHLQAQDMTKLGFMPDLVRGIKKLIGVEEHPVHSHEPASHNTYSHVDVDPLLRRVQIFLEGGDWVNADIYCEKVLDSDPENKSAYVYKLLAQLKVKSVAQLDEMNTPLEQFSQYRNAVRYADEETSKKLIEINNNIRDRVERAEQERRRLQELRDQKAREYQKLVTARDNTVSAVQAQARTADRLSESIAEFDSVLANRGKYRRAVLIRAILVLAFAALTVATFFTYIDGPMNDFPPFILLWIGVALSARSLANIRGKSGVAAVLLSLFTYGIYPVGAAITSMVSVRKDKEAEMIAQRNDMQVQLKQVQESLAQSRQALNSLNQQIENFN